MRFTAIFKEIDKKLPVVFNSSEKGFNVIFDGIQTATAKPDAEYYEGEYEVTPKVDAQTLATKQKLMQEDVTIKEIPFFNVGNTAGGSTVYIGREI